MKLFSFLLILACPFTFALFEKLSVQEKLSLFEDSISKMAFDYDPEATDAAVELSEDSELPYYFSNSGLFKEVFEFYYKNRDSSMPKSIKQAIELMLKCPGLDLSNMNVDLLSKAFSNGPEFPELLEKIKPSDRLFEHISVAYVLAKTDTAKRNLSELGKASLVKYYGKVSIIPWLTVLNLVLSKSSAYHAQRHLLMNDLLPHLISDANKLDSTIKLARNLGYSSVVKFLEPVLKIFVMAQVTGILWEGHGVPSEISLEIIRRLIALEFTKQE